MRRAIAAGMLGAGLVFLSVRSFSVVAPPSQRPSAMTAITSGDPSTIERNAMVAAGAAARTGAGLDVAVRNFRQLAKVDPLNPAPYLFAGAVAARSGQREQAGALFRSAALRDPRSEAAHYFLANLALSNGDVDEGLDQLAILSRLNPHSVDFSKTFAAYAGTGEDPGAIRRALERNPASRDELLYALAADAGNADLIVSLVASAPTGPISTEHDWRARLVQALAAAGDYDGARLRWIELGGERFPDGLSSPGFGTGGAPPPFNWTYPGGDAGIAEPSGDGSLDVLYYGRSDAVMAEQTIRLLPGRYRLSMPASGDGQPDALAWRLVCVANSSPIASIPLAKGQTVGEFDIPVGCAAQKLTLAASAGATDDNSHWTIGRLSLTAVRP